MKKFLLLAIAISDIRDSLLSWLLTIPDHPQNTAAAKVESYIVIKNNLTIKRRKQGRKEGRVQGHFRLAVQG